MISSLLFIACSEYGFVDKGRPNPYTEQDDETTPPDDVSSPPEDVSEPADPPEEAVNEPASNPTSEPAEPTWEPVPETKNMSSWIETRIYRWLRQAVTELSNVLFEFM